MRGSGRGSDCRGENKKGFRETFGRMGGKGEGVEKGLLSCEDGGCGFLVRSELVDQGENGGNVYKDILSLRDEETG